MTASRWRDIPGGAARATAFFTSAPKSRVTVNFPFCSASSTMPVRSHGSPDSPPSPAGMPTSPVCPRNIPNQMVGGSAQESSSAHRNTSPGGGNFR